MTTAYRKRGTLHDDLDADYDLVILAHHLGGSGVRYYVAGVRAARAEPGDVSDLNRGKGGSGNRTTDTGS
jgi:hypothetical protein